MEAMLFYLSTPECARGHGGIGRRVGFRCQWATVWVRVPLTACRQMEKKRRDAGSANRDLKLLFCRAASLFAVRLCGGAIRGIFQN